MTPRAQGKEWAEKVVAEESFYEPSIALSVAVVDDVVKLIRKQHSRAVRIVKATRKGVPSEPCEAWKDGYMTACDDILTALQRGRGETTPEHQAECWWYRAKAALTPAGQRWTKRTPTKEGVYWFRNNENCESVVQVYRHKDDGWCMYGVEIEHCTIRSLERDGYDELTNCEWQGPITPNEATE